MEKKKKQEKETKKKLEPAKKKKKKKKKYRPDNGLIDERTYGRTDERTNGHDLLQRFVVASLKRETEEKQQILQ